MREVRLPVATDGAGQVWFGATEELEPSGDAEIALNLIPAMRIGAAVSVDRASPRLLRNLARVQEIFRCWDRTLKMVNVATTGNGRVPAGPVRERVGAFFSGGVDSFYRLLSNREEITDLILVHGFDYERHRSELRRRVVDAAREVAAELRKNLIEVETDYRSRVDPLVHWRLGHGPALAVVALLLQERLSKVLAPATHSYRTLIPLGSHPLVDPLWSTERLELVHHGAERTSPEKIAYMGESPLAMRHLRVCYQNLSGRYNCGRCQKCLLTMVDLRTTGLLERCDTLPSAIDLSSVERLRLTSESGREVVIDSLSYLDASHPDRRLALAPERCLRRQPLWDRAERLRKRAGRVRRRLLVAARTPCAR